MFVLNVTKKRNIQEFYGNVCVYVCNRTIKRTLKKTQAKERNEEQNKDKTSYCLHIDENNVYI
jgi:hypothetical protein